MWCNILNNEAIIALAGVVVGFVLSEVSSSCKKYKERKDCKKALFDEVRFNHEQSLNKIDILSQAIAALRKEHFLSTKCSKYSTTEFDNLYHIALPMLDELQRDNLRHLNSYYKTIDDLLDGFDETIKNDLDNASNRHNTFESVYEAAVVQLDSIKQSLTTSTELSSRLLGGNPLPIFEREKT